VRRLLRRCLEKDPGERLRDAHDLRLALEDREEEAAPGAAWPSAAARRQVPARSVMVAAALTLLGGVILGMLAALLWIDRRDPAVPAAFEKRLEIVTPATEDPVTFALSPDGRRLVFVANVEGKPLLWLRSLDSTAADRSLARRAPTFRSGLPTAARLRSSPIAHSSASTSSPARSRCSPQSTGRVAGPGGRTAPS
jgi:hypothetical protein